MVLESVATASLAKRRPEEFIFYGFIVATVALLLSIWVFPAYASFALVTFTVMATLPLMVSVIKSEKEKIKDTPDIKQYKKTMLFFVFLFSGYILAFLLWFIILPVETSNNLFFLQLNTIAQINSPTGGAIFASSFGTIIMNNLKILGFAVLFSFIFGSGAIFILTWNASVISAAVGSTIKIAIAAGQAGSASYLSAAVYGLARYLIHGIPELTGYFLGGLAGGIISFAVLDYKLGSKKFFKSVKNAIKSSGVLLIAAVIFLVMAALIELAVVAVY